MMSKNTGDVEVRDARRKTALWLTRVLEQRTRMDDSFFRCLFWVLGDKEPLLRAVLQAMKTGRNKNGVADAMKALQDVLANMRMLDLASVCEELIGDHPCMEAFFYACAEESCRAAASDGTDGSVFEQASRGFERVFGLGPEAWRVCEFIFLIQHFSEVEHYFEDELRVFRFGRRRLLSSMLDIPFSRLRPLINELVSLGLMDTFGDSLRLSEIMLAFWDGEEPRQDLLFCRPLEGESLPLSAFRISADVKRHVLKLLKNGGGEPVHILLYGASGTGKSSFVRALAAACGVSAWSVSSRENDSDSDRRASLTACLNLSSRHKGSFVVVDEAERLLDTDLVFGRQTKDKAWLNDFLEKPGRRVIWISNQVEHIDPAVRRRFTYSIHFEKLDVHDRVEVWRQVMRRLGMARSFSEPRMKELSLKYPVEAAVIQEAVSQARRLYGGSRDFSQALERILKAHLTLQADGNFQPRRSLSSESDFTMSGVCLEGDAEQLMQRCRRVDAALRRGDAPRPGCGTMLFYGPPGTGKTALARHIAGELNRECLCMRASDLMGAFVGETEKNIARAFRQAEHSGSVLVIDEADSFLFSRESARHSWESSMINEFLTSLEQCRAFCICTTNRREMLDAAAMRRFSYKVAFGYAKSGQIRTLYETMLAPLCGEALPEQLCRKLLALRNLTPGDFHAVRMQYDPLFAEPGQVSHEELVQALAREAELKLEEREGALGFLYRKAL